MQPRAIASSFALGLTVAFVASRAALGQEAAEGPPVPKPQVIVFVCDHGVAKSALAAAVFNNMAAKRGLSLRAERRAADTPQLEPSVSTNKGLAADGLPIPEGVPEKLSAQDVQKALRIITLGISRPIPGAEGKREDWADVPMVGDGYPAARDAVSRHVSRLIDEITTHQVTVGW